MRRLVTSPTITSLNTRAWLSLAALALVMALLLFVSAGTIRFWYAWVYLALFFGVSPPSSHRT